MQPGKLLSRLTKPRSPRFGGNILSSNKPQGATHQLTASTESLLLLNNALGERAGEFWITAPGSMGPQWVRLPDYLRQAGWI